MRLDKTCQQMNRMEMTITGVDKKVYQITFPFISVSQCKVFVMPEEGCWKRQREPAGMQLQNA
jgi:hypothetical protein